MNFGKKWKFKIPAILLGGITIAGTFLSSYKKDSRNIAAVPSPKEVIHPKVKNPTMRVFYRTDTIEKRSPILLYNNKGNILRHYKVGDDLYRMLMFLFAHEAWHSHNLKTGFRDKYKLSPKQYRNLLMHDEISANLVALNTLILEYMLSDNKPEFLKQFDNNRFFSFYFKEVAKGNITPFSTDSAMIEKDFSLRINGVIKNWMERSYKSYSSRQEDMLFNYIRRFGLYEAHDKNYQKILRKMYNIGGVDFWKYAESDINTKDVDLFDNLTAIKSFPKKNKLIMEEIRKFAPLLKKITDNKQRIAAVQHLIISAEIKAKIKANSYKIDEKIVTILYNKTRTKYSQDHDFSAFADKTSLLTQSIKVADDKNENSLADFIHKVYTLDEVDLSAKINNFNRIDLPYKPDNSTFSYEAEDNNVIVWNDLDEMISSTIQVTDTELTDKLLTQSTSRGHPHRSGVQSVIIPNFEEPILVALNTAQIEILRKTYKDFDVTAKREFANEENLQSAQKSKKQMQKMRSL